MARIPTTNACENQARLDLRSTRLAIGGEVSWPFDVRAGEGERPGRRIRKSAKLNQDVRFKGGIIGSRVASVSNCRR